MRVKLVNLRIQKIQTINFFKIEWFKSSLAMSGQTPPRPGPAQSYQIIVLICRKLFMSNIKIIRYCSRTLFLVRSILSDLVLA